MRVVFDTNIYVSAFVLPGSSADRAMQHIFDELLTILVRKFSRDMMPEVKDEKHS